MAIPERCPVCDRRKAARRGRIHQDITKCYAHQYRDKFDDDRLDVVPDWDKRWMTEDCHRHRVDWRERAIKAKLPCPVCQKVIEYDDKESDLVALEVGFKEFMLNFVARVVVHRACLGEEFFEGLKTKKVIYKERK